MAVCLTAVLKFIKPIIMANSERAKYLSFFIVNLKLRNRGDNSDVDPSEYIRIFRKVYRQKVHAPSSNSKNCIIRFMFEEKEKGEIEYLYGTFAQFTYIQNERWFSLESLDMDNEFKVPNGLFPDAKITEFVFIPKAHRFCYRVFSGFNVSPYGIKKFLEVSLGSVLPDKYYLQVDVESDRSTLDLIFSSELIKKLSIDINYSNSDIGTDLKKFVEEDIRSSNTSRLKIEATQKPNVSINVKGSKILTGAVESSISNGETEATIIGDDNKVKKIKTSDFPRKEFVYGVQSRFGHLVFEKVIELFRPNRSSGKIRKSKK